MLNSATNTLESAVEPSPKEQAARPALDSKMSSPRRVMLVDDEKDFIETLSERLELRDMEVAVAFDGAAALEQVRRQEPEIMVLDLMMPVMDGYEVLKRVRQDHPAVMVVILTGHGSADDRVRCLAAGAFAYLQKPVGLEELYQVMGQAAAGRREGAGA